MHMYIFSKKMAYYACIFKTKKISFLLEIIV